MPDPKFGAVGLNNVIYTATNTVVGNAIQKSGGSIISARVKHIILDDSDVDLFNKFGGWDSIGVVFWELISNPYPGNTYNEQLFALPIFPNIKNYPLKNEIIYLVQLTNNKTDENLTSNNYYYFPPLNIWQSQQHNAYPSFDNDPNQNMPRATYDEAFQGLQSQPEDNVSILDLGSTFQEKSNLHPLLPYEGDIIYEGRFGNSIRFGSTVQNAFIENNWSSNGDNGDPITIIRNGQPEEETSSPWEPITENINNDLSSIYLTSKQSIPLFPSNTNNSSFAKSTPPENANQYTGNQIILNSGRLTFNAKKDSILLLSNKSIQLSCTETIGMNASQIALTADKVYLGSSEGVEGTSLQSAILGENLVQQLTLLVTTLKQLSVSITNAVDSNGAPISDFIAVGTTATSVCTDILNTLNKKPETKGSILSQKIKIRQ